MKPRKKPETPGTKMWESSDKEYPSITVSCYFAERLFTVVVRHVSGKEVRESFRASYTPVFGMDIEDMALSQELAGRLSDQLAAELELTKGPKQPHDPAI